MYVELLRFEKIRRRSKERSYKEVLSEKFESQTRGSIHLMPDKAVQFDGKVRENYKEKRPVVVTTPPRPNATYETECAPGTSKYQNRNPKNCIIINAGESNLQKTTAFLLNYRRDYKSSSLGRRIGKFNADKIDELEKKLGIN
ncbi:MAG: type II toxin-antitoxin system PemK/MazF family toxin [Bacteroidetes bacterium]|nr:MAG: type II toxin-antitoxin system PemK/MazF family toxin [Bacteroidota bacterium]